MTQRHWVGSHKDFEMRLGHIIWCWWRKQKRTPTQQQQQQYHHQTTTAHKPNKLRKTFYYTCKQTRQIKQ